MRLLHSVCVEIILLATLVTSLEIGALVPSSTSGCLSSGVNAVLQKVVGHFSDETPVVFDRYWASDTTQALVVERLPEPFMTSNIRDCADFIVREGHFAFEFLQDQCTAISLSSDLCCEETSGSPIYVSELFDGGSGEPVTDQETGVTMQSIPPILLDMTTIPGVSSSTDENDLQPEDGNVALKDTDGTIYTFPLEFLDVDNCIGTSPCGPTCYYNRSSPPPTSHYLSDYCGREIPVSINIGDVIVSHRGFGCEYMPDELVGQHCQVLIYVNQYSAAAIHLFDLDDSDSCDGFSLTYESVRGREDYDICAENKTTIDISDAYGVFVISVTKQQRLGFIVGPLSNVSMSDIAWT